MSAAFYVSECCLSDRIQDGRLRADEGYIFSRFTDQGILQLRGYILDPRWIGPDTSVAVDVPTLLYSRPAEATMEVLIRGTARPVPHTQEDIIWAHDAEVDLTLKGSTLTITGLSRHLPEKKTASNVSVYVPRLGELHTDFVEDRGCLTIAGITIDTRSHTIEVDGQVLQDTPDPLLRMLAKFAMTKRCAVSSWDLRTACGYSNQKAFGSPMFLARRYMNHVLPKGYAIEYADHGSGFYILKSPNISPK